VNWSRTAPRLPFIARFAGKSYESLIRPMRLCEAALVESDGDRRSAEISKLGQASHFPGHLPRLAKIIAFQTGSHGSRDPDEADRSLSDRPVQTMAMATGSSAVRRALAPARYVICPSNRCEDSTPWGFGYWPSGMIGLVLVVIIVFAALSARAGPP
jgi:hypothetical protein